MSYLMKGRVLITLLFPSVFLSATGAGAQVNVQAIDAIMADYSGPTEPCCALAVYQSGETVFSKGYGLANLEYDIPNSVDSVFHVASISKQFTAFSILLLEEEGKLSLDDDIRDHLPEMPDFGEVITIRHLLNHTSGLRDQWELLMLAGYRADDIKTNEDIYRLLTRQQELNFPPGDRYLYSNSGYTLMALIVERLSGQTLREFTQQNIFEPLGMHNTHFNDSLNEVVVNRSYGYTRASKDKYQRSIPAFDTVGATSLFTTVDDFALWDRNFDEMEVGSSDVFEKLLTRGQLNSGEEISYAGGVGVTNYRGLEMISHSGADAGYRGVYMRFPQTDISIALFANTPINTQEAAFKVLELFQGDEYTEPAPGEERQAQLARFTEVPQDTLNALTGSYRAAESPGVWRVSRGSAPNTLMLRGDGGNFMLGATDEDHFEAVNPETRLQLSFFRGADNGRYLEIYMDSQPPIRADLAPAVEDLASYAEALTGNYYSPELDSRIEIRMDGTQVIAQHYKIGRVPLLVTHEDVLSSLAGLVLVMDRDETGKVTGFHASTGRILNLEYLKTSEE